MGNSQSESRVATPKDASPGDRRSIALLRSSSALLQELVEEIGVPDETAVEIIHECNGDELGILRAVAKHINDKDPNSHLSGQARSSKLADKFRRSVHAKEIESLRSLGFSDVNTLRALRENGYREADAIKMLLKEYHRQSLANHPTASFHERMWSRENSKESKGSGALTIGDEAPPTPNSTSARSPHTSSTNISTGAAEDLKTPFASEFPVAKVTEACEVSGLLNIVQADPIFVERKNHDKAMLQAFQGHSSIKWNPALVRAMVAMKRKADDAKASVRKRDGPPDSTINVRRGTSQTNLLKERLTNFGMSEVVVSGDGNCQFRAISKELFNTQDHHLWVRFKAVEHMRNHRDEFEIFFGSPEEFEAYVAKMSLPREWGDELTLKATADALDIVVHVLTSTEGFGGYYLEYSPSNKGSPHGVLRHVFLTYLSPMHYNVMTLRDDERRKRLSDRARDLLARADSKALLLQVPSIDASAMPSDIASISSSSSSPSSSSSSRSVGSDPQTPDTL